MGKIGDYNANIGIGNLYKVIEHGQEMGVVTQKDPECSGSGWKFDIPLSMKTPGIGSKIYDKAIRKFESDAKLDAGNIDPKVREKEVSDRLRRADETAKALCDDDKGGIEPFADELAGELHVKSSDKQKMAALRKITEQLFASKTVTWWGALKKEKQEELKKQEETKQAEMAKQEEYEKALRKADELDGPKKDEALKKLEDARKEDEAKKNLETLEKKAAADNLGDKITDLDRRLGRDFSKSDLMAAAVTLSHMVARGELDINHVETYLNETVFDYADQKATLQMTARAMGELRAKVIGEGWGDEYSRLVRIYAKSSEDRKKFLFCAYENLVVAADKIREKRIELVRELGLASIPAQTGGSTGETLRRLTKQLEVRALAAFSNDAHCACDEVKEFKMKAEEFRSELAKLSFDLEGEELEDYLKKNERRDESLGDERVFTPEFQKDVATYLKVLSQGAKLSARLEREEEIRKSFKKALGVIPRDENGLCRAGTYSVSFSLGASLSWGLDSGKPEFGAKDSKATLGAGASAGFTATVSIGEDGSASVSYGLNLSGDVTAGLEAPGVTVSGGGGLGGGWTKATAYKDIDSMCNDTSRMLLALTTGKEMKNLFHGGGVNSKSRDVAKRIDNYAMRSLMSEMKLMDDTDPYLTPMKYNPVTGIMDTFSGDLHGNARFSGGSDAKKAKNFIAKSGISGGASISLSGSISSAKNLKSHFAIARERGVLPKDDAKYGPGLVRYDYQHADEGLRGRAMPRETQLKNLTARLEDLEAELEDFARAAAVEKRSHGHSRAGTDARFAAARSEAYKGMTYKDFLKKRGIELGVYWGIRNLFVRNIRRTLYAGDLAREAAYCEAKIRDLMPDSDLPDDAKRAVKAIEDGIYHNHLLHLDTAGRFSAERSALYQTERELSAAETVTASVDMKLKIPDKGNFPGIEKAQSLKVTSKYTNVELTPNDFYPEATSGAGWKRLTPAQKNFDPAMKRLEESAGKELLPLRPWESKESLVVSVDVSAVPFAGEILDLSFRKGLNADLAGKSASADLVRELVFRHVNKAIAESAKKSASTFIKGISPSDGVFKADQSHTITFRLVKEYRPNGKYVYKLKETSLDAKGRQSAGIGMPAKPGLKFSAGVARSSSENVRYWVGEDSLSGVMSRYGRLGRKTVMWEAFLNEQRNSIADLAKNAGAPKYIRGEDLTSEEFEPRTGLQGELDRIQQHMWMHGDRAQYDAFMNAWADVHAAAGAINSADENAQKYGKAMTRLLSTISNFYRKENAWWEMKEMPLASGPAAQGKEPPAKVKPKTEVDSEKQLELDFLAWVENGKKFSPFVSAEDLQKIYGNYLQNNKAPKDIGNLQKKLSEGKHEVPLVHELQTNQNKMDPETFKQRVEFFNARVKRNGEGVILNQKNNLANESAEEFIKRHNLTRKIADLRAKIMQTLKIDARFDGWLRSECPTLNPGSEEFKKIVNATLTKNKSKGPDEIIRQIVSNCLPKDAYFGNGGSATYVMVWDADKGKLKVRHEEENRVVSLEQYLRQDPPHLNVNYQHIRALMAQTPEELKKNETMFVNFKNEFKDKVSSLLPSKEFLKGKLTDVSDEEVEDIHKIIRKTYIDPILKANHFWEITLNDAKTYRNELVLRLKTVEDPSLSAVVKEFIEEQITGNFALKEKSGNSEKVVLGRREPKPDKTGKVSQGTVSEFVKRVIKEDRFLEQKGTNNCFIISVVNALLSNEKGRKILENCFCRADNTYQFNKNGSAFEVTDEEVNKFKTDNQKLEMSDLEWVVWTAMKKAAGTGELNAQPGNQWYAADVASIFGLKQKNWENDGIGIPENALGVWVNARNHLAGGQIAVVHEGNDNNGHYLAVKEVESQDGKRHIVCYNSSGKEGEKTHLPGEFLRASDSGNAGVQMLLFEFPRDNGLKS